MRAAIAIALLCVCASASASTTNWLRCAFAGTRCLPTVSIKSTSTTSKPKPTTTDPTIKNK